MAISTTSQPPAPPPPHLTSPAPWLPLQVRVELHVAYLQRTSPLAELLARLPPWAALSFEATNYASYWEF